MAATATTKNKKPKIRTLTGGKCIVCDIDYEGDHEKVDIHRTRRQAHSLCVDCAMGYLKPEMERRTETARRGMIGDEDMMIKCPGSFHGAQKNQCKCEVNISMLCARVDGKHDELYLMMFRLAWFLNNAENHRVCMNKKCGNVIPINPKGLNNDPHIDCLECKTEWCAKCYAVPYHHGITCLENRLINEDSPEMKELLALREKGELRFCPKCEAPTSKTQGCNKITCSQCRAKWCWVCGIGGIDYDHFNDQSKKKCAGKLWEGVAEENRAW